MEQTVTGFLDALSTRLFWLSAAALVLVNGAAVLAFALTRNRRLVDVWTPRVLVTDGVLLATGLGGPLLTGLARFGVHALATMASGLVGLFK